MRYHTGSVRETQAVAARVARSVARRKPVRRAVIFGLVGDLGSGKTTFTQGFARALGIKRRLVSPTFTIMRRYALPKNSTAYHTGFRSLVHVDAYRVHQPHELKVIRFEEWLRDPSAIVLVEWADLVEKRFLRGMKMVRLAHGRDKSRIISTQ